MTFQQTQRAYAQGVTTASTNGAHFDTRDPTPNDITWSVGQIWVNTSGQTLYYLNNFVSSAGNVTANWIALSAAPTTLEYLQGNTGGLIAPDSAFKIQVLGTGTLTVTGDPVAHSLTISDSSIISGTVTTSGLQTQTLLTIPTTANTTTAIDAIIAGYGTPIGAGVSAGIGGFLSATFLSGSVNTSSIDVPDVIQHSFLSATATFTTTGSGLNILLQVTGDVAYNINWRGYATIATVG